MQAITVRDRDAGVAGLSLVTDLPYPAAAENDVIVRVHAAGFTPWGTRLAGHSTDRVGHDRTPSVTGHELSGVVVELGYGSTGLSVGQRVFGLADWTRNGTLAEYTAVEARNLAPLSADIDHGRLTPPARPSWSTALRAASGRSRCGSPAKSTPASSAPVAPPTGTRRSCPASTPSSPLRPRNWRRPARSMSCST
jgi:hypothetical protein